MPREQRRLAAIVAADVVGYSRLMGRDESGTLAALKALRCELVDPLVAEHGGRVVKSTGDGLLLEFPSVVDAVRCAVAVQIGMVKRNVSISDDVRILFRVGINVGDVIVEGDDIFGDGVNVAARLEPLADPGGICVSDRVYRDVRGRLEADFTDSGEQALKNITEPVRVWRWRGGSRPAAPTVPPIELTLPAVLPGQLEAAALELATLAAERDRDLAKARAEYERKIAEIEREADKEDDAAKAAEKRREKLREADARYREKVAKISANHDEKAVKFRRP